MYKQLGTKNNNKDVRIQMQQKLDSSLTGQMSPLFQLNLNPGYEMENGM